MNPMYRQGDVLLIKVDAAGVSTGARRRPRDNGRVVLARGEATGHAHAIDSPLADLFEESDGQLYLRVDAGAPAELVHEEHAPILLEPGVYRIVRQRQYAPGRDQGDPVED
jgi:hypothetical protein